MPVTRMGNRIEALERTVTQISPLRATVVKLKGDLKHLNVKLGMELGKMNDKLETSLAMGRKELNEGLQIITKIIKGLPLDSTAMTGEGSGVKSTSTFEKSAESEPIIPEKVATQSGEGNYRKLELPLFTGVDPDSWIFQAERYFSMNRFSTAERVVAAGVCMEGGCLVLVSMGGRKGTHT